MIVLIFRLFQTKEKKKSGWLKTLPPRISTPTQGKHTAYGAGLSLTTCRTFFS